MDTTKLINNVQGLHNNIAEDVWPDGADMICDRCGHTEHLTTAECGYSLAHGWPRCCNSEMRMYTDALHETDKE